MMTLGLWPPILSQVALEMDVPITLGSAEEGQAAKPIV